jgi:hypothetical protein
MSRLRLFKQVRFVFSAPVLFARRIGVPFLCEKTIINYFKLYFLKKQV